MAEYSIALYSEDKKAQWDTFIDQCLNATFLLRRDFMEYHADRFRDYSLMVYKSNALKAILPGNLTDSTLHSHAGLTYGGFYFDTDLNEVEIKEIVKEVINDIKSKKIGCFQIKMQPSFYSPRLHLALQKVYTHLNAKLYRTDKVLAIDYSQPLKIHKTKLKHYRKNLGKGYLIKEEDNFKPFWNLVLEPRLKEKHQTVPVHTSYEIALLKSRFPKEIKQFNIYFNNDLLAGVTIFDKGDIVKSQYGATTKSGEKARALEFLFLHLIFKYKEEGRLFYSMGTVRDLSKPLGFNMGLLKQKEELGCAVYNQDFYKIIL